MDDLVSYTLQRAGIKSEDSDKSRIMYIDDWAVYGTTIDGLIRAAGKHGLPASSVYYATLCGDRVVNVPHHIVGDPTINPRRAVWDVEGGDPDFIGVKFNDDAGIVPESARNHLSVF